MLDKRTSTDRRSMMMTNRRQSFNRRVKVVSVGMNRRAGDDRRVRQNRRVHLDRRAAAARFLDIA
jgi:hypothetical protein